MGNIGWRYHNQIVKMESLSSSAHVQPNWKILANQNNSSFVTCDIFAVRVTQDAFSSLFGDLFMVSQERIIFLRRCFGLCMSYNIFAMVWAFEAINIFFVGLKGLLKYLTELLTHFAPNTEVRADG